VTVFVFPLVLTLVGPLIIVAGLVMVAVSLKNVEIMPFEGGEIREPRDRYPTGFVGWVSAAQTVVLDVESTVSRKRVATGLLFAYVGLAYSLVAVLPVTVAWIAALRAY
jgi:hypothetical protein